MLSRLLAVFCVFSFCSAASASLPIPPATAPRPELSLRGNPFFSANVRVLHAAPMLADGESESCASFIPPAPLSTPAPMGNNPGQRRMTVDLIIDGGGAINAVLLLHQGNARPEVVRNTLARWRYRPAMCNGVPVDSQMRIEIRAPGSIPPQPAARSSHEPTGL